MLHEHGIVDIGADGKNTISQRPQPCHVVAICGNIDVICMLLEHGANIIEKWNGTYFFQLQEFVDVLNCVLDMMTAVIKVDYCSYFLMYSLATFLGISSAV